MGDCNYVQPRDAAPPQIRRDHVLAEIELRGATTDGTSGIDEQGASLRRDEQRGISLTDINRSDLQQAATDSRLRRNECEDHRPPTNCHQAGDLVCRTT